MKLDAREIIRSLLDIFNIWLICITSHICLQSRPRIVFLTHTLDAFEWPHDIPISDEAKHFVDALLQFEPSRRLGANGVHEIKNHPWLRETNWSASLIFHPVTQLVQYFIIISSFLSLSPKYRDTLLQTPMEQFFIPKSRDDEDTSHFFTNNRTSFSVLLALPSQLHL